MKGVLLGWAGGSPVRAGPRAWASEPVDSPCGQVSRVARGNVSSSQRATLHQACANSILPGALWREAAGRPAGCVSSQAARLRAQDPSSGCCCPLRMQGEGVWVSAGWEGRAVPHIQRVGSLLTGHLGAGVSVPERVAVVPATTIPPWHRQVQKPPGCRVLSAPLVLYAAGWCPVEPLGAFSLVHVGTSPRGTDTEADAPVPSPACGHGTSPLQARGMAIADLSGCPSPGLAAFGFRASLGRGVRPEARVLPPGWPVTTPAEGGLLRAGGQRADAGLAPAVREFCAPPPPSLLLGRGSICSWTPLPTPAAPATPLRPHPPCRGLGEGSWALMAGQCPGVSGEGSCTVPTGPQLPEVPAGLAVQPAAVVPRLQSHHERPSSQTLCDFPSTRRAPWCIWREGGAGRRAEGETGPRPWGGVHTAAHPVPPGPQTPPACPGCQPPSSLADPFCLWEPGVGWRGSRLGSGLGWPSGWRPDALCAGSEGHWVGQAAPEGPCVCHMRGWAVPRDRACLCREVWEACPIEGSCLVRRSRGGAVGRGAGYPQPGQREAPGLGSRGKSWL